MDLIVTKWIAMEGAVILAGDKKDVLCSRFSEALISRVLGLETELSTAREEQAAVGFGVEKIQPLAEGGIFTALWRLAERLESGLEADLRKIPVKQEIIEICEYFDLNPYNMLSGGSLLIAAQNGIPLIEELEKLQISAVVVGRTTGGNAKIIRNQGHVRYLDRPQKEELYQIYKERWKEKASWQI